MSPPTQKRTGKQPSREASSLAALLKSEIVRNKTDYRIRPAQERAWALTAQRMLDIDKRQPEQIERLIRWVQRDEFWMPNVLSMNALREKFDQLELKARPENSGGVGTTPTPETYVPASKRILQERNAERPVEGVQ